VGGVYKHFDSKEAILVAVVHRRGPDLQKLMQECASQDLDAVEKMSRLISNRIAFFRKWPDYGRLSARMFSFRLEGFPAPANLPAQIDEFHEFFGGVVAQGQAEGVFCSGSPTRIASLLAALMNAYQQMDPELISDSDGLGADEFLQMALRAISAPKTRSPRARRATS
jgi:AcrR family transcriptional regulator